jgi:ubiquinone/menaquinone biosynthesis C-methylase UbiE/GT2 family glycosyltransferase
MKFEIIICTKDRATDLVITLESILQQTTKPERVMIIDSGSQSADYNTLNQKFSNAAIAWQVIKSEPGLTHQRNVGITHATCEIVLFLDDDVTLLPDYCAAVISVFTHDPEKKIGGVTGKITNDPFIPGLISTGVRKLFWLPLPKKGEMLPSGFANGIHHLVDQPINVQWLSGCNMAYRKEVLGQFWFDENLKGYSYAEDADFSYRVSKVKQLVFEPKASLVHRTSPANRLRQFKKAEMWVVNHHYLFKKNLEQTFRTRLAHAISLAGILIQKLLLEKSVKGFLGAASGILQILFLRNYQLPNYLERLDFHKPYKNQIAEHKVRYRYIADRCHDKMVLDCACGEGIGTNILKEVAKNVVAVDIDSSTVKRARKNVPTPTVEFICASATDLPLANGSVDVITCVETLEHVPMKLHPQMIAEFHRVLKNDGILYLTTPNKKITSPGYVAAKNYFHIAEISNEQLHNLLQNKFSHVKMMGLRNPLRDKQVLQQSQTSASKLSFRKAIMLFLPDAVKDGLSLLIKRRHVYPQEHEFVFTDEDSENTANLICIATR